MGMGREQRASQAGVTAEPSAIRALDMSAIPLDRRLATWAWRASEWWWAWPVAGAWIAVVTCLIVAHQAGFPLDDAWIHQDFARTLATTGRFAFQPGGSGAGSTSPVWVLVLLLPQLVIHGNPPIWLVVGWSAAVGAAVLAALGVLTGLAALDVARAAGQAERIARLAALLAGLVVVSEWHLVWAAVSGMETNLFALLSLGLIVGAARGIKPLRLGVLAALAVGTRPEGAVVAALVGAGTLYWRLKPHLRAFGHEVRRRGLSGQSGGKGDSGVRRFGGLGEESGGTGDSIWPRTRGWAWGWAAPFVAGAAVGLLPYIWLNLAASGAPLPSTFFAKATFYGGSTSLLALVQYVVQVGQVLLVSSPGLLVLGVLSCSHGLLTRDAGAARGAATSAQGRAPVPDRAFVDAGAPLRALLWAWPLALLAAYAVHLPVAYQHARYQMPALPPLIALAAAGAAPLLIDGNRRLLASAGALLLVATGLLSLWRAAQIYASNVRYIQDFQITTALWLRRHTAADALIATHDVGAIGYFSGRPVLDMAGLINPQVVPLMPDQPALEAYLARRHAAYVVMFVDWFPAPAVLAHDLEHNAAFTARAAEFPSGPDTLFVVYRTGW
jgi:hypothetical protein